MNVFSIGASKTGASVSKLLRIFATVAFALTLLLTQTAYASTQTSTTAEAETETETGYQNYDFIENMHNDLQNGKIGDGNTVSKGSNAISTVFNVHLLPIAIAICLTRVMYIIVCPMMMRIDPLDMLDSDTWRGGNQYDPYVATRNGKKTILQPTAQRGSFTKGGWDMEDRLTPEVISATLKGELINAGKAILIVLSVWALLNFAMIIASLIVGNAEVQLNGIEW